MKICNFKTNRHGNLRDVQSGPGLFLSIEAFALALFLSSGEVKG